MRGDVETGLLTIDHHPRQLTPHRFLQDILLPHAAYLVTFRQRRCKLYDPMIQEWRAYFERMRHAHAIRLIKYIVGEIVVLVRE